MVRRTTRWRAATLAAAMAAALATAAACSGGGAGAKATRSARAAITPTPTLLPIVKTLAAGLPTAYAEATTHAATFPAGPPIDGMSWVSADEGWVLRGGFVSGVVEAAQVVHTTDGGATWRLQHEEKSFIAAAIQFVDPEHGWVAGRSGGSCSPEIHPQPDCRGALLRTSDGGKTWTTSSPTGAWLDDIRFTSASSGWATAFTACNTCTDNPLLAMHTSDGGLTWSQQTLVTWPVDANEGHALASIDDRSAVVATSEQTYRTDDGGATWRTVSPSPCTQTQSAVHGGSIARVYMLDAATGWAICEGGAANGFRGSSLYQTTNGGNAWRLISDIETTPAHALPGVGIFPGGNGQMQFFDPLEGWYATDQRSVYVSHTTDGGFNWAGVQTPIFDGIAMVQFVDRQHGWIANDRQIARTTDGGAHWTEIALPP